MRRTLNYTGRSKIRRKDVEIQLTSDSSGKLAYTIKANLAHLSLPGEARVFVEAYRRTLYLRFDHGTVTSISSTARPLDGVAEDSAIKFRVKVVDQASARGKILALAEGLSPSNLQPEEEGGRTSILHTEGAALGQQLWRLRISDEFMPVLEVNHDVPGIKELARSDKTFQALVFPEVVRAVLRHMIIAGCASSTDLESDPGWRRKWWIFTARFNSDPLPSPDEDHEVRRMEREDWIDDAVEGFAEALELMKGYVTANDLG